MMRIVLRHAQPTRFHNMPGSSLPESLHRSLHQHMYHTLDKEDDTLVALTGDPQACSRNPSRRDSLRIRDTKERSVACKLQHTFPDILSWRNPSHAHLRENRSPVGRCTSARSAYTD